MSAKMRPDAPVKTSGDYMPYPMVSIFVDNIPMTCMICYEEMGLGVPGKPQEGATPCLLFCGHVVCYECWEKYRALRSEAHEAPKCPACNAVFQHEECRCYSRPKPLDLVVILYLPPTHPAGGKLGDYCHECSLNVSGTVLAEMMGYIHEPDFAKGRAKYSQTKSEEDKQALLAQEKNVKILIRSVYQQDALFEW